jgi:hypothetical protein
MLIYRTKLQVPLFVFVQDYNLVLCMLGALDQFSIFISECIYQESRQLNWLLIVLNFQFIDVYRLELGSMLNVLRPNYHHVPRE